MDFIQAFFADAGVQEAIIALVGISYEHDRGGFAH